MKVRGADRRARLIVKAAAAATAAVVALASRPAFAPAASDVWDGNGANPPDGVWGTNANWVDNTTPGNSDTAQLNASAGGAYTVTFNANPLAIQALTLGSSADVTLISSGGVRTLNVNSASGVQDLAMSGAATLLSLGTAAGNAVNLNIGDDLSIQGGGLFATFGSDVTASDFSAAGLNGTVVVSGSGSTLVLNGAGANNLIGRSGNTGTLILDGSSTGNSIAGDLGLADSASAGSVGNLSLSDGSALSLAGNLTMANQNVTGQSAEIAIDGISSSLTQTGATTITVGSATNGTASINVGTFVSGASFSTGTGAMTINATGTVTLGAGANNGFLTANGNVIIDGGTLTRTNGSGFNLAAGKTLTIQNGGNFNFAGIYSTQNATYAVTGSGSILQSTGSPSALGIDNGAQVNVSAGGDVTSAGFIDIGTDGNGTLSVTGSGSLAAASAGGPSWWGGDGGTAIVTFSDSATGTFSGGIDLALGTAAGTTANVTVQSGADLTVGGLTLTNLGGVSTVAKLTVTGAGSTVTATSLVVGHSSAGTAEIDVLSGGSLSVGGAATLLPTTDFNVSSGATATFGSLAMTGSVISGLGGTVILNGQLTTSASVKPSLIGPPVNLNGGTRVFQVADGATVTDLMLASAVQNGGLTKTGAGTLHLGSFNTYTGPTSVSAGKLELFRPLTASSAVNVSSTGRIELMPDGTSNNVVHTPTLTITGSGRIDIKDNKIITASAIGSFVGTAYTGVSGLVDRGRGDTINGQWNGTGITTTDTRAINNNDLCSIGVATAFRVRNVDSSETTTFGGQTILGSDTLVMFTWGGDANLDGKINIDDYGQIDFNVGSSGSVFGWSNGDFNYDGKINIDDYGIIDFNVTAQTGVFLTGGGIEGVAAVPEPAGATLLAAAIWGTLARRRRTDFT